MSHGREKKEESDQPRIIATQELKPREGNTLLAAVRTESQCQISAERKSENDFFVLFNDGIRPVEHSIQLLPSEKKLRNPRIFLLENKLDAAVVFYRKGDSFVYLFNILEKKWILDFPVSNIIIHDVSLSKDGQHLLCRGVERMYAPLDNSMKEDKAVIYHIEDKSRMTYSVDDWKTLLNELGVEECPNERIPNTPFSFLVQGEEVQLWEEKLCLANVKLHSVYITSFGVTPEFNIFVTCEDRVTHQHSYRVIAFPQIENFLATCHHVAKTLDQCIPINNVSNLALEYAGLFRYFPKEEQNNNPSQSYSKGLNHG